MTADVTAQAWAVVQAIGLGLAAGLLYDLFRVLRVRIHVPLLGPLLDLLFWITLTGLGRHGAAVWSGVFVLWGLRIFLAAQFRCALGGLPFGRSGHFCTKNLSSPVDCTKPAPEKNQKTCKKYLPFWGKMG